MVKVALKSKNDNDRKKLIDKIEKNNRYNKENLTHLACVSIPLALAGLFIYLMIIFLRL